ncbi:MAG: hypothetical protein IJF98_07830 [Firmicutes bacterium]|nr:hypothetical protein [Bacillota bacterium]
MYDSYDRDIFQIPGQDGKKRISIIIDTMLRFPNVYLDFYEKDDVWTLYWRAGKPAMELFSIAKKLNLPEGTVWDDVVAREDFICEALKDTSVCSLTIDTETSGLLWNLCRDGLPGDSFGGFDGHDYIVKIADLNKEYTCWCYLPEEWKLLADIINKCVEYAGLDKDTFGCMVYESKADA